MFQAENFTSLQQVIRYLLYLLYQYIILFYMNNAFTSIIMMVALLLIMIVPILLIVRLIKYLRVKEEILKEELKQAREKTSQSEK